MSHLVSIVGVKQFLTQIYIYFTGWKVKSGYIQITCDRIKLEFWNKYLTNKTSMRYHTSVTISSLAVLFGI